MPVVTKEQLVLILEHTQQKHRAQNHKRQSFGPAEVDKWLFFTSDANCFIMPDENKSSTTKKKIILSNYLLNLLEYSPLDAAILDALVAYYDVYLWPGEDVNFATAKPVTHAAQLWENRQYIHGGTQESVLSHLAQQGIATNDMIVLDFNLYEDLASEIQQLYEEDLQDVERGRNLVNLQSFDSKNTEACIQIAKSLESSNIQEVYGYSPTRADFQFIKKIFPQLKVYIPKSGNEAFEQECNLAMEILGEIRVAFPSTDYSFSNQKCRVSNKNQLLNWINTDPSRIKHLIIPSNVNIPSINSDLDLRPFKNLIHCELWNSTQGKVHWPNEISIQSLVVHGNENFEFLHQDKLNHLSWLRIVGSRQKNLDLKNFYNLKFLQTNVPGNQIEFAKNAVLESVILRSPIENQEFLDALPPDVKEMELKIVTKNLNFKKFKKLRRLTLDLSEQNNKLSFTECKEECIIFPKELEVLSLRSGKSMINFVGAEKLKVFNSVFCGFDKLDLTYCSELESLNIDQCSFAENKINLNGLKKLKYAIINTCLKRKDYHFNLKGACSLSKLAITNEDNIFINLEECDQLQSLYLSSLNENCKSIVSNHPDHYLNLRYCFIEESDGNELISRLPLDCSLVLPKQDVSSLRYENNQSPVSIFSLENRSGVDAKTKPNDTHKATGHFVVTLYGRDISKTKYRIQIYDKISYHDYKLLFHSDISLSDCLEIKKIMSSYDSKKIEQVQQSVKINAHQVAGVFSGTLLPEKIYPLPTQCAQNENDLIEIYCNSSHGAVQVIWNKANRQYYVTCKQKTKLDILYQFSINSDYDKKPSQIKLAETSLLPQSLREELQTRLKGHAPLQFLFEKYSPLEKLNKLYDYCKSFRVEELKVEVKSDLDIIIACIFEKKGVCRHRSRAFMLLAHLIGIPSKLIENETHSFCEVHGHLFDFGGGELLDLTPKGVRQDPFKPLPIDNELKKEIKETKTEKNPFTDHFKQIISQSEFKTIQQLLDHKSILPPLIALSSNQDPLDVRKAIAQQIKQPFVYIHTSQEFLNYLTPYKLQDGHIIQSKGPLANLIAQGGYLIVNWSNFTPQEIAIYKSIVDSKPTLAGQELKQVKVIGLKTENTEACSAFSSRCQLYTLHAKGLKSETKEIKPSDKKPIEKNLFHHSNWRERLLGKIKFGQSVTVKEGPLLQAIKDNKPLTILNPPADESFHLFLRQLQDERRFLYMDEWKNLPANVTVNIQQKSYSYQNKIKIHTNYQNLNRELIYIGGLNLYECFEKLVLDEKTNQLKDAEGFLKAYQEGKNAFYITSPISKADWDRMQHYIHKNCSTRVFDFILAPGGAIEGLDLKPSQVAMDEKMVPAIIVSSDPDFECLKLKKDNDVLVIDVTPQMGIQDLLFKVERKLDAKETVSSQQKDMATALLNKQRVILNGDISALLYQQLRPLLACQNPHFYLNGKRHALSENQLRLILPSSTKNLLMQPYVERNYASIKAYYSVFHQDDRVFLDKIARFYECAKQVVHQGGGLPPELRVSYQLLKRMVEKLKHGKLHTQNPIKGLFHYQYPKNNADFAYLNVAAKLCFQEGKTEQMGICHKKLKVWMQNKDYFKQHCWSALNCLSANTLLHLFPNGIEAYLEPGAYAPMLSQQSLNTAWEFLQKEMIKEVKSEPKKRFHVEKRAEQLATLLEDKNTPFIFLKGEAGVGKSHAVRHLKDKLNFSYHEGQDDIEKWLNDTKSNKPIVLLLDEANLAKPGTWDFFKGLSRDRQVYYKGKLYQLTERHKIIMTGNPEFYPGRFHHAFFQDYVETLYFKMPDPEFIEKTILNRILKPANLEKCISSLLKAYQLAVTSNPAVIYSNRDLESLAQRLCLLTSTSCEDIPSAILNACRIEFGGSFSSLEKREQFVTELSKLLNTPLKTLKKGVTLKFPDTSLDSLFIPSEKYDYVEAICQDLLIREKTLEAKDEIPCKQGILLEGAAGLGKSTLFEALLLEKGYSKESKNTQKKYYVISAGDKSAHEILLTAFSEGAVVILDELNLDKSLETLLNQLLTGCDLRGNKATQPGFMVLASQNPSFEKGRQSVSQALRNRFHMQYMESYSEQGLIEIATQRQLTEKEAKQFVTAYLEEKAQNRSVNMRTFYTALNMLPCISANKTCNNVLMW